MVRDFGYFAWLASTPVPFKHNSFSRVWDPRCNHVSQRDGKSMRLKLFSVESCGNWRSPQSNIECDLACNYSLFEMCTLLGGHVVSDKWQPRVMVVRSKKLDLILVVPGKTWAWL